jgi:hypothetical protein
MSGHRRANAIAPRTRRRTEQSGEKLGEDFLAALIARGGDTAWTCWSGLRSERVYCRAMVRLAEIHQRQLPEPPAFDRQRYRADVMERLQERARQRRANNRPRILVPNFRWDKRENID